MKILNRVAPVALATLVAMHMPISNANTFETKSGERVKTLMNENKLIVSICRPAAKQDAYKKLPKPKMANLAKAIGVPENQLIQFAEQQPAQIPPYILNLGQYADAFDSQPIKDVFGDFLKTRNPRFLAVLHETSQMSAYDKKKKAIKGDAGFAMGLITSYLGKPDVGHKYFEGAIKEKHAGAGYIQGLRAYKGYDMPANLNKAGNRMVKAFQAVQKKYNYAPIPASDAFSQRVEAHFLELVLEPQFQYRDTYVDMLAKAQEAKAEREAQMAQQTAEADPQILRTTARLEYLRNQLQQDIADALGMGPEIAGLVADAAIWSDQGSQDAAMVETLRQQNDKMAELILAQLAKADTLDGEAAKKFEGAYQTNEQLISAASAQYLSWLVKTMATMAPPNMAEVVLVNGSFDKSVKKMCDMWNSMGAYSARVDLKIEPVSEAEFSENIDDI